MRLIDFYQENKKLYHDVLNTIENCLCCYSCGKHTIYEEQDYILTIDVLTIIRSEMATMFWIMFTVKYSDEIIYEVSDYFPKKQIDKECFFLSLLCKYNKLSMIKELYKTILGK